MRKKSVKSKVASHLREDIKGYKENIRESKKENKHEIKEDKDLLKVLKKVSPRKMNGKKKPC